MTLIFAHRGSAGTHPENTMEAFYEAERVKADGIELDVQLTKDGEMVVIHDETVNRTTNGKGFVKDYSLKEIQKLQANFTFKSKLFKKNRVPSLKEVFQWLKGNELLCNIELKNSIIDYQGLEEKVIALIREFGFEERIIISSFNHYSIVACYRLEPAVEIAPLYSSGLFMPWIYAQSLRAKGIHPNLKAVRDDIIIEAMNNGICVRPYTVNKVEQMERLLNLGCTAFVTDYPEKARKLRETNKKG
ncbi:glycerophosphodiester phosphodiesterase [Rossellomorea sp. YZS02]|uniref:glycerophosphodiester phosphodiesterase n=1 Tax=Rossellomorea sp. YZS02 TaxID=3097358 RepID=UPI002A161FD7|nr:glycerophosphodiester phosphodiesterase [Rossellomorea sp. YZS02]MDX8344841.1 glycerophosphodiester phosphodiesterase [Rossellomorea sp. YZS02]